MQSFWESVKKGLEEGVSAVRRGAFVAKEMTEDTIKISKLRYGIHGLRDDIKATFAEIGGRIFDAVDEGKIAVPKDEKIEELLEDVREQRKRIQEIEAEIEEIHRREGTADKKEETVKKKSKKPAEERGEKPVD